MKKTKQYLSLIAAVALLVGIALQAMPVGRASAATVQIGSPRKMTLEAGATDGGSKPGGTVKHLFNFSLTDTSDQLGSIKFQYCTTAAAVPNGIDCNLPGSANGNDMNTTGATLNNESGVIGFSMVSATPNGTVILSRTASLISAGAVSYELANIVNPDDAETFFVRISTYTSTDGTGTALEAGTVAAATSTQVILNGTMPESLVFCAGATVGINAGNVPDCSTVTTGNVLFDRLFSPTDTAQATSQMAASTNAGFGYAITVNGPTLTSGSNTINPVGTVDYSKQGTSQFGMNLVKNTAFCGASCDLGANITQAGGTLYNGEALTGYATGGANCTIVGCAQFKFASADPVADSTNAASDGQIYTVSYVVNVPGSQPAGTYVSTLTYICTPTF